MKTVRRGDSGESLEKSAEGARRIFRRISQAKGWSKHFAYQHWLVLLFFSRLSLSGQPFFFSLPVEKGEIWKHYFLS